VRVCVVSFEKEATRFLEKKVYFKIYSRHRRVINIIVEDTLLPLVKRDYFVFPGCVVLNNFDYFLKNDRGYVIFSGGKKVTLKKRKKINISNAVKKYILNKISFMNNFDDVFIKKNVLNWDKLIGVGEGLTPKGDDFILGYSFFSKEKNFKNFFLNTDFTRRTNIISAHFLENAKKGIYSETILNFISGRYDSLLNWGQTSGLWTAFGIIKALQHITLPYFVGGKL